MPSTANLNIAPTWMIAFSRKFGGRLLRGSTSVSFDFLPVVWPHGQYRGRVAKRDLLGHSVSRRRWRLHHGNGGSAQPDDVRLVKPGGKTETKIICFRCGMRLESTGDYHGCYPSVASKQTKLNYVFRSCKKGERQMRMAPTKVVVSVIVIKEHLHRHHNSDYVARRKGAAVPVVSICFKLQVLLSLQGGSWGSTVDHNPNSNNRFPWEDTFVFLSADLIGAWRKMISKPCVSSVFQISPQTGHRKMKDS